MTASAPPRDPSESGSSPQLDRQRGLRRVRAWGFAISAVLHLVALAIYPRLFGGLPAGPPPGPLAPELPPEGIEVVNVIEVSDPAAETPPEPVEETERQPIPVPVRPPVAQPAEEEADPVEERAADPGGRTAAERLRPRTNDGRLWAPLPVEITALTTEQQLQNLLYARFFEVRDSLAALGDLGPNLDWTHTDGDGNKWGVSPGRLHLGPITIPLPFGFGAPSGASDDLLRRLQMDADIRRAAGQAAADQTAEERARAIRERREAERRRNPPDTTRSGGGGGEE